jgi:hypothetical protein
MITAIVVDNLCTRFQHQPKIGIAYIYCNFQRQVEQKPEDLLASLLKQLIQGQPTVPDGVKDLHSRHKGKLTRPSKEELSRVLQSTLAVYKKAFIIVDALDECTARYRTTFLSEIFSLQAKSVTNIFATSRMNSEIAKSFDGVLSLKIRAIDEDLKRYLDGEMLKQPDIFNTAIREMAAAEIIKAADGM